MLAQGKVGWTPTGGQSSAALGTHRQNRATTLKALHNRRVVWNAFSVHAYVNAS